MYPIDIIGIGLCKDDMTAKHLDLIRECSVLAGGERHLGLFSHLGKQEIVIKGSINKVVDAIKEKMDHHKIVVLASGDPLFYGIGATLLQYFDKDQLNIHSNISSVSAAFAAIKEPWHDALIVSFHKKKEAETISFSRFSNENKIAFLTSPDMNPAYVSAMMIKEGVYDFRFCVLENLGVKDKEKISWFDNIDLVRKETFQEPNIVILMKRLLQKNIVSRETHIGMDDSLFKHSRGLITKSEIRSVTLSKLKLYRKDHVLWDIGSGSGSIGIEASFLLPWGTVYAIEKHPGRISDIIHNFKNFNCSNVKVMNAEFPAGIEELRMPDRIFIGGGGQNMAQIMEACCEKLAPYGTIVINTVLLQTLGTVMACLEKYKFKTETIQLQVSKSKAMPYGERLEAMNPVWIISGSKK